MDESYKYRNRPLKQQATRELIPKLYSGQTKTRQEIIEGVEREHRRRGGEPTEDRSSRGPLAAAFKGATRWLKHGGAMEDAGFGYWHVLGEPSAAPSPQSAPDQRRRGRDSTSDEAYREHMKLALYAWQNGRCATAACNRYFPNAVDFDLDHVVPRARDGGDEPGNLQLLCRLCNTQKGAGGSRPAI
ncbi:MAG: HNH endonuclease signature motif containing protein [Gammaproteobacteria bacterium]|nr:HNH endonuclease signature motif containing protein [Gammaproteobacteria bacterium]